MQEEKEVAMVACKKNRGCLHAASEKLHADKDVVMAAVTQDGDALLYASKEMQDDKDVVTAAVQNCQDKCESYLKVNKAANRDTFEKRTTSDELEHLCSIVVDPNVLSWEYKKSPALQFASALMKSVKEVVLRAVKVCGFSLWHACEDLRSDREVAMVAIAQDGRALKYASKELRHDSDVVVAAVEQNMHANGSGLVWWHG